MIRRSLADTRTWERWRSWPGTRLRARDFYLQAIVTDKNNVLARMQLASLYERTFHDYHSAARMCGEARLLAPATPGVVDCVERNQRLAAVPMGR